MDNKNMIDRILDTLAHADYIKPDELPNIDLYMDQVTTFMESRLSGRKRYPEDKILTKTMINNYAKNHLLPSPEKKRYSREHMLLLIFIYYFKNILTINDIQTLLEPITEKYFNSESDRDLTYIYNEVFGMEEDHLETLKEDLRRCYDVSQKTFPDADDRDQELLKTFSFICLLAFDVYMKKNIIENLIDDMRPASENKKARKEKPKKEK